MCVGGTFLKIHNVCGPFNNNYPNLEGTMLKTDNGKGTEFLIREISQTDKGDRFAR